jgi:hypothetical protein
MGARSQEPAHRGLSVASWRFPATSCSRAAFVAALLAIASSASGGGTGPAELSVGFRGGLNLAQHTGVEERDSQYTVDSGWRAAATAGFFVYWPITARLGLQQEIVYTQKGSTQRITVDILDIPTTLDVTYEVDYIEIPTLIRFNSFLWDDASLYSLFGTAMSLKTGGRYVLSGTLTDGEQAIPLSADADLREVDMFDFSLIYGTGYELDVGGKRLLLEYRFTMSWNSLAMPTYAYVPFEDGELLIENEPVPLKNQTHCVTLGIRF